MNRKRLAALLVCIVTTGVAGCGSKKAPTGAQVGPQSAQNAANAAAARQQAMSRGR